MGFINPSKMYIPEITQKKLPLIVNRRNGKGSYHIHVSDEARRLAGFDGFDTASATQPGASTQVAGLTAVIKAIRVINLSFALSKWSFMN